MIGCPVSERFNSSIAASRGLRILLCDPDPAARRVLRAALGRHELLNVLEADGLDAACALVKGADVALVALMPGEEAGLERLLAAGFAGGIVAALDQGSVAGAVAAMRSGAQDVALKPLRAEEVVERLLAVARTNRGERRRALRADTRAPTTAQGADFCGFLGRSPAMARIYERIGRIASSRAPVFVTGESGTGKELAAAAVHARSPRHDAPFHAVNCSAIPRELMESEMFGHVRGAFTGAHADRAGAVELADGGTLFLDEIGEMDLALQAKLLRVLQEGRVRRIGEGHERQVDVRIVCATNRDPVAEVRAGRLREDLFYRLHVLHLHLPPLRERGEDVLRLAEAFLARFAGEEGRPMPRLGAEAAAALMQRHWRGNVRELQNLMRRVVVLSDGPVVPVRLLDEDIMETERAGPVLSQADVAAMGAYVEAPVAARQAGLIEPFAVVERRVIEEAIAAFDGNVTLAASALDLAPSTLYRKRLAWQKAQGQSLRVVAGSG
ncbi:sigma 54-interacting transcriptional regulator [Xanthobacter sp. TB0139]|uniref:sigma 54-interacting transcriptional regulator n=1 Tax=Xanthobacter sp. TB0139 TaxID=3459178 RepID=UPI00403976F8